MKVKNFVVKGCNLYSSKETGMRVNSKQASGECKTATFSMASSCITSPKARATIIFHFEVCGAARCDIRIS